MSKIVVYKDGVRVGILQNCTSIQWGEKYQAAGEVLIIAAPTPENKHLLTVGTRLYNTDSDTSAVIVEAVAEADEDRTLTVRADIAVSALAERVVMGSRQISNVERDMYGLVRENLRGLPIALAEPIGFAETAETEVAWEPVLDALETLAAVSGLGFKVCFDPVTAAETFAVYRGTDRSRRNEDYVGSFSTALGNIDTLTLRESVIDYKNVAMVVGEDEIVVEVALDDVPAQSRREMVVEVSNVRQERLLHSRGLEALAEQLKTFEVACEVKQNNMRFGRDYYLGDRLPVALEDHGIAMSARVASVRHVYETEGNRTIVTLDEFERSV